MKLRFYPWPRNFYMPCVQPKKKKKKRERRKKEYVHFLKQYNENWRGKMLLRLAIRNRSK